MNPSEKVLQGSAKDLFRLIAAQILVHASMSGLRLAAPLLALGQGMGKGAAGLVVALFALGQVLVALPAGRLADQRGMRLPVRIGIVGAVIGMSMAAAWPSYPTIFVSAVMAGASVCLVMVAVQRFAGRSAGTGESLRRVYSWISLSTAVANFLGPLVAGLLIDGVGFRWTFVALALAAASAGVMVRGVRDVPHGSSEVSKQETAWALWRQPGFRRVLLINWVLSAYWDIHSFLVPVLGHDRGLSASVIGGVLSGFSLAAAMVRAAMPYLASRIREWAMLTVALVGTGLLFLAYPWAPNAWVMGVCSVLLGIVLGGVQPMVMALLHQVTHPSQRGQAAAMRLLLINASNVSTPLLVGSLGALMGTGVVFALLGLVALACAPMGRKFQDLPH